MGHTSHRPSNKLHRRVSIPTSRRHVHALPEQCSCICRDNLSIRCRVHYWVCNQQKQELPVLKKYRAEMEWTSSLMSSTAAQQRSPEVWLTREDSFPISVLLTRCRS